MLAKRGPSLERGAAPGALPAYSAGSTRMTSMNPVLEPKGLRSERIRMRCLPGPSRTWPRL